MLVTVETPIAGVGRVAGDAGQTQGGAVGNADVMTHSDQDDRVLGRDGVEIGAGFKSIEQRGSEHGDEITPEGFLTNNAGGVLGGISTGQPITVSLAIKPTSSIRTERRSIDRAGNPVMVKTLGRHDPCVGIRATPIAEALLALILIDHALRHRAQCG